MVRDSYVVGTIVRGRGEARSAVQRGRVRGSRDGGAGAQAVWTTGTDVSIVVGEPEKGVLYRLNCTAISEGPINYRFSTTGMAAVSLAIGTPIG